MKSYLEMSKDELISLQTELLKAYDAAKGKGLSLDMSRGKPAPAQLDLVMPLMDALSSESIIKTTAGTDCRNYGGLDGIPEAKAFIGEMLSVDPESVIVCGNSSLNIMYDNISRSMTHGVLGSTPWAKLDKIKFICPAPGYDRHFKITETFGIEMLTVPMTPSGPDMDLVEEYVKDEAVKGIWCIPKYSNPTGYTFSDETVDRLASLKPAAKDFRIYWDNAYAVHDLYEDDQDELKEILSACKAAGNENMVFEFCSTSKISFAGAGIAAVATSPENKKWILSTMTIQTIGYDKINQLRHVAYYKNMAGVKEQMMKHAKLLRPKFEATIAVFEKELAGLEIGSWTTPKGGYFISFQSMNGCAKEIVAKCKEAGVTLTGAGATYPYGVDPADSNIRIAPSFPTPEEMAAAAELFALCVKLVSIEHLLAA